MLKRIVFPITLIIILLALMTLPLDVMQSGSTDDYVDVDVSEAKEMIESNPYLVILDVRTLEEYNEGHIENAVLIPVDELESRLDELDSEKDTLVYCRSGVRSVTASQILVDNGFSSVYNMLGGIIAWRNEGYWIEIIHEGDLIIDGTETFVIENCTYIQTGNIHVYGYGTLLLRSCELVLNQTANHQYSIRAEQNAKLFSLDTNISSNYEFDQDFGGNSILNFTRTCWKGSDDLALLWTRFSGQSLNILDSSGFMHVYVETNARFSNVTGPSVRTYAGTVLASESANVFIDDSEFEGALISVRDSILNITDLKGGHIEYFNTFNNITANVGLLSNLTVLNSEIPLGFQVFNSEIVFAGCDIYGFEAYDSSRVTVTSSVVRARMSVRDQVSLSVFNTTVYGHIRTGGDSIVDVHDSNVSWMIFGEKSIVTLYDSTTSIASFWDLTSDVFMSNVTILSFADITIRPTVWDSRFNLSGNISFSESAWAGYWNNSSVTRNFNVLVKNASDSPLAGSELRLCDINNTLVYTTITDYLGRTDFTLTFTESNYTATLILEAVKGNMFAATSISFLSDTPVVLTLAERDIAIVDVAPFKTVVGQGYSAYINVTVENQGDTAEIFDITVCANETEIEKEEVTLTSGSLENITFTWNTTDFAKGNYTMSAYVALIPGGENTTNNEFTDGWVIVAMVGDITGPDGWPDGKCDMRDVSALAKLFGIGYPHPLYNPNYDIYPPICDRKIDMKDISIVAKNFGRTDP